MNELEERKAIFITTEKVGEEKMDRPSEENFVPNHCSLRSHSGANVFETRTMFALSGVSRSWTAAMDCQERYRERE